MLTLERLYQFLAKLRDLSAMFSPWWSRSSDPQQVVSQPEKVLQARKKTAAFRLSTSIAQTDVSELDGVKLSKKKSKHKRSKSKRRSPDSISDFTKRNKSQFKDEPSDEGQSESSGKKRESCRIINLKIPLPDDAALLLGRYYYHNPYRDYSQSKDDSAKPQEDANQAAKRTKRKGGRRINSEPEPQPTLSEC